MKRVKWSIRSTDDLRDIQAYLSDAYSPMAASDMIRRLVLATDRLAEYPMAGPSIGQHDWRKWRPARSSYVLVYRPVGNDIEVLRVHHAATDWREP